MPADRPLALSFKRGGLCLNSMPGISQLCGCHHRTHQSQHTPTHPGPVCTDVRHPQNTATVLAAIQDHPHRTRKHQWPTSMPNDINTVHNAATELAAMHAPPVRLSALLFKKKEQAKECWPSRGCRACPHKTHGQLSKILINGQLASSAITLPTPSSHARANQSPTHPNLTPTFASHHPLCTVLNCQQT